MAESISQLKRIDIMRFIAVEDRAILIRTIPDEFETFDVTFDIKNKSGLTVAKEFRQINERNNINHCWDYQFDFLQEQEKVKIQWKGAASLKEE